MLSKTLALALVLAPYTVLGAMYPANSLVKSVDAKAFKKAMKDHRTAVVAFVAPWCGHCQKLVPEYSKAAAELNPLIPLYAVDCDAEENKPFCSEQGIKGFPTMKIFTRGELKAPIEYREERSAPAIVEWATKRVPNKVTKTANVDAISKWINKDTEKPRALLLTKEKKVPLLWKVLDNRYTDKIDFAIHRDEKGAAAAAMGLEAGDKTKVLVFPAGSTSAAPYKGVTKYDALTAFFDSVVDGTANLEPSLNPNNAKADPQEAPKLKVQEPDNAAFDDFEAKLAAARAAGAPENDMHMGEWEADAVKTHRKVGKPKASNTSEQAATTAETSSDSTAATPPVVDSETSEVAGSAGNAEATTSSAPSVDKTQTMEAASSPEPVSETKAHPTDEL